MTNEEKELLLKDICARLPYGVFVDENIEKLDKDPVIYMYDYHPYIDRCKPYLRPMSSMTEEEKKEYAILCRDCLEQDTVDYNISHLDDSMIIYVIDWLNKKMFDHRGLIPMGLALPATEDMYK